jgi:sugar phosphate isomerase/epimerase
MKGPAIFLAQFLRNEPPYDDIASTAAWAAEQGYVGVQIPAWNPLAIDLALAATSKQYCAEYRGLLEEHGLQPTELAAFIAGALLVLHPAYDALYEDLHPLGLSAAERTQWAAGEIEKTIAASRNLGTTVVPVLSGGLAWPMVYPFPRRPQGIVEAAFDELVRRWRPLLDRAHEEGIVLAYELHPGSDLFDGATWERFLDAVDGHPAACLNYDPSHFLLQQLDYVEFVKLYGDRIRGFHVKDAEFRPSGRMGVYGGFAPWAERAGRFRSPGDGQVDFRRVFTALAEVGFDGWAVLEWECAVKSGEQGAAEGAPFIAQHIIELPEVSFDDLRGGSADPARNRRILGLAAE